MVPNGNGNQYKIYLFNTLSFLTENIKTVLKYLKYILYKHLTYIQINIMPILNRFYSFQSIIISEMYSALLFSYIITQLVTGALSYINSNYLFILKL